MSSTEDGERQKMQGTLKAQNRKSPRNIKVSLHQPER